MEWSKIDTGSISWIQDAKISPNYLLLHDMVYFSNIPHTCVNRQKNLHFKSLRVERRAAVSKRISGLRKKAFCQIHCRYYKLAVNLNGIIVEDFPLLHNLFCERQIWMLNSYNFFFHVISRTQNQRLHSHDCGESQFIFHFSWTFMINCSKHAFSTTSASDFNLDLVTGKFSIAP